MRENQREREREREGERQRNFLLFPYRELTTVRQVFYSIYAKTKVRKKSKDDVFKTSEEHKHNSNETDTSKFCIVMAHLKETTGQKLIFLHFQGPNPFSITVNTYD